MTIVCRSALIQDMECTQIHILLLRTWHCRPCHWGAVNGGCVVVSEPHLSHPIRVFRLRVYETTRAAREKLPTDENLPDGKAMFARWRGWLFIPLYESICVGFWRFPEGSLSSWWSSIFDEGLSLKIFIQYSWVDGGGDFIQREVFQALPRGREARIRGNIRTFRSVRSQSTAEIFLAHDHTGGVHNTSMLCHRKSEIHFWIRFFANASS